MSGINASTIDRGQGRTPFGLGLRDVAKYGIYIAFCGLFIFLSISSPTFLTTENILNILRQSSLNGIIAVGMTFVIITGGIDLSVGSIVALAAVVATSFAHPDT